MISWVEDSLDKKQLQDARNEASDHLLKGALGFSLPSDISANVHFIADALDLAICDVLDDEGQISELRRLGAEAFQLLRVLPRASDPVQAGQQVLRMACLGTLGDRGIDVARLLREEPWPDLPLDSPSWGTRSLATVLDIWLRLLRKDGWGDLDRVLNNVLFLRQQQQAFEASYLQERGSTVRAAAWELVAIYHLVRAAEVLATFTTQGHVDGHFDIRQQLEAQFDRATIACGRAELVELDNISRLLGRTAQQLVDNCLWTIARGVPALMSEFVENLTSRGRVRPVFEMFPPQRRALREAGLLGTGRRAIVVSLPTSSGKTFIAEFRILQALNQFNEQRGWTAYLAPTRALVNQICARLRRDFAPLGISVERVSPALEIDGLEARILEEHDANDQFRVLVTTPEKLDLLLRGGWERRIRRPLTLVVVDEAHNLAQKERGIKLELLLATINRECRDAKFLLLTPFIKNGAEIARWLDPDDNQDISMELDWQPNDRAIVLSRPVRGDGRGGFSLRLETLHTSKQTLVVPESIMLEVERPLGLTWSGVSQSVGKLAAVNAALLRERGSVIVLAGSIPNVWSLARNFKRGDPIQTIDPDVGLVQRYLRAEFGDDFALCELLSYGVGVHHSGLSDEARQLMEWLLERERIQVLVATTTIAQGVNFPVSAVVMASHQYPYGEDMPPEDFWNVAGRVGRADQSQIGIVTLAATDEAHANKIRAFVSRGVSSLNSTLVTMVQAAMQGMTMPELHSLFHQPEWSAFLQYLAHTYRQIGDPGRFANEIEQVMRGTLGFQSLRRQRLDWAQQLIVGVQAYAKRIANKPLQLVDTTGWSWESISSTLSRLSQQRITRDVWDPDALFRSGSRSLQQLMGILLQVPELRENLEAATGGQLPDGVKLAHMVSDWVNGASLQQMAQEYFSVDRGGRRVEPTDALTECCKNIYGKLTQTASWGLAALQSMTFRDDFDKLPATDQQTLRNLPARVFYGVNTDAAIALRLVGTPRSAARPLARVLGTTVSDMPLPQLRNALRLNDGAVWSLGMPAVGKDYYRVWKILEASE